MTRKKETKQQAARRLNWAKYIIKGMESLAEYLYKSKDIDGFTKDTIRFALNNAQNDLTSRERVLGIRSRK